MSRRRYLCACLVAASLVAVAVVIVGRPRGTADRTNDGVDVPRDPPPRIRCQSADGVRIPPGPEEWKRFDGEWSFQRSSTTGTFSLTQGLGYCVLTRNGYRQVWVIELLEVFDGNLVDFGLYPLGEEDDVTVWTGNVRDNGDVGVFRALFSVSPLPDAPFLLRRRE